MGIRVVVAMLVVLVGCDDDIDLSGTYEVSSSVGGEPCGNDQPVTATPAFLKFYKQEFLGQEFFAYDGCTDAAATDCINLGGLFNGFYEPNDTGWSGEQTFSFSGNSCTLGYTLQEATLIGKDLVVDSATYSEEAALEGDACSVEAAKQRNTDMPCIQHARIDAVKIE